MSTAVERVAAFAAAWRAKREGAAGSGIIYTIRGADSQALAVADLEAVTELARSAGEADSMMAELTRARVRSLRQAQSHYGDHQAEWHALAALIGTAQSEL